MNKVTDLKEFVKNFYTFNTSKEIFFAGSDPIKDTDNSEGDITTPLTSSWIHSVMYNVEAKTGIVFFDTAATNGKDAVNLWGDSAIDKIKGMIGASSPGKYYLNNIVKDGNCFTSLLKDTFDTIKDIGQDIGQKIIPRMLVKFFEKAKNFYNLIKNVVLVSVQHIGQTVAKLISKLIGTNVLQIKDALTMINLLEKTVGRYSTRILEKALSGKTLNAFQNKIAQSILSKYNSAVAKGASTVAAKGIASKATVVASQRAITTFLSIITKIFNFIGIASFIIGIAVEIGMTVVNNAKILQAEEQRIQANKTLDKEGDINFLKKMNKLKVDLAFASSFSPAGIVRKVKTKAISTVKKPINKQLKKAQNVINKPFNKLEEKIDDVKRSLYKDNPQFKKAEELKQNAKNTSKTLKNTAKAFKLR